MSAALLILASSLTGQAMFYPGGGGYGGYRGYGYYNRTPLPLYDPIRYARYYNGEGFYNYAPPPVLPPQVYVPRKRNRGCRS